MCWSLSCFAFFELYSKNKMVSCENEKAHHPRNSIPWKGPVLSKSFWRKQEVIISDERNGWSVGTLSLLLFKNVVKVCKWFNFSLLLTNDDNNCIPKNKKRTRKKASQYRKGNERTWNEHLFDMWMSYNFSVCLILKRKAGKKIRSLCSEKGHTKKMKKEIKMRII